MDEVARTSEVMETHPRDCVNRSRRRARSRRTTSACVRPGAMTYLEFHLVVPGAMQVADAHVICDRVEAALKAETPGLVVTIHVEPEGKAKHSGVLVL